MQRFLLSLLIILGSSSLFAQSIEDIEAQVAKGEYDKAKTSVDAFLTKEKNAVKPDGWWYKGVIYNEIAKSEKYKSLAPEGRMEAFNAFKKYYPAMNIPAPDASKAWFGYRPVTPDGLPYIGKHGKYTNLTYAGGHAMLGVSLAAATGKLVDEIISHKKLSLSISSFDPERFG